MSSLNFSQSSPSASSQGRKKAGRAGRDGSGGDSNRGDDVVTEEQIGAERALLVSERQSQLAGVLDRHDDLVREVFHLEKFVTMVAFDPKAAKEDNSAVFQEYKAGYDLLEKASSDTSSPTRKTRSAHSERLQNLGASMISSHPVSSHSKSKNWPTKSSNDAIWDIISSAKGKNWKGKGVAIDGGGMNGNGTMHGGVTDFGDQQSLGSVDRGTDSQKDTSYPLVHSNHLPIPRPSKRRMTDSHPASGHRSPPRKRRKTDPPEPIPTSLNDCKDPPPPLLPAHPSTPKIPTRSSARLVSLTNTSPHSSDVHRSSLSTLPHNVKNESVPTAPIFKIKRVRLLVRRPPPSVSNPRQRPPKPRYGSSLTTFLSSYKTLGGREVEEEAIGNMVRRDAALLDRIDSFRQQGRLLSFNEGFSAHVANSISNKPSVIVEPKRGPDVWDHVIAAVASQPRVRRSNGRHIASQVASKIQAYWDGFAAKKDKAKLQEEKRLRALAKSTIKLVISEWKKAVFHIREQERLRLVAEERRLGHEHLDAILDQSGQILETQHIDLRRGDMSRSRSRSSSRSAPLLSDEAAGSSSENAEEASACSEDEELGDGIGQDLIEPGSLDDASMSSRTGTPEREGSIPDIHNASDGADRDDDAYSTTPVDEMVAIDYSSGRSSSPSGPDVTDDRLEDYHLPPPPSPEGSVHPDDSNLHEAPDSRSDDIQEADTPLNFDIETQKDEAIEQDLTSSVGDGEVEQDHVSEDSDLIDAGDEEKDISAVFEIEDLPGTMDDTLTAQISTISQTGDLGEEVIESHADASADAAAPDMDEQDPQEDVSIPDYLKPYAVAPVVWDPETKIKPPVLLRGILRPYQQSGLEWLASLHTNHLNGILADEMGLGKTIQSISLLAHLACDMGIWGPHLIVVPTSVLLNWEMEFKKFLPGFRVLSYHGSTKRRKELRQGWNDKHHFNVCITSYTLASRDAHIFKRKAWYYMILDEAHMIKNFKSQRWNILLMFRPFRRLLLTGTPLQNNLTELWALLQFLMSGTNFANLKEFGEWFSNPLERAIEMGNVLDDEALQRVSKLHTVLRPYLLRRLKRDVEKELPRKYDHLVLCPLSKRQRFLYDEFLSRSQTQDALQSGIYQKVANILMQLRKVCNHPNLFEVRPIVTSFAMDRSAIADFEIKELLIRRRLLNTSGETLNLDVLGLRFIDRQNTSIIAALESRNLDATSHLPFFADLSRDPPPKDTRSIAGFKRFMVHHRQTETMARWSYVRYLNRLRCHRLPIYSQEVIAFVKSLNDPLFPPSTPHPRVRYMDRADKVSSLIKPHETRAADMADLIDKFAFVTPPVVALDMPRILFSGSAAMVRDTVRTTNIDAVLHRASVKLQIAFPDPSLLQYDCGKLQELTRLLREKKAGGHRVLVFTQMTKILDILEIFLNFHGYLYLRLDGATKIEDRQYITERFNADSRVFCFIASSRSGGVGINLTGADTVVFYDSDFNPQMDKQCEDRAHRIGQIRDVHVYRFISQHTVEEAMLRKANQKRSLDDIVIQKGEFDWRTLFRDEAALTQALGEFEDKEDAHAAAVAAREEVVMEGADEADFGGDGEADGASNLPVDNDNATAAARNDGEEAEPEDEEVREEDPEEAEEEGGTTVEYMVTFVRRDYEFFKDWRL